MSIDAPTQTDDYSALTDWLELTALFSFNGIAKIDDILSAFEIGVDTCDENISEVDAQIEDYGSYLSDEVQRRLEALTEHAYPFSISDNGELLRLREELTYGHKAYLASLIHQNSSNAGKLSGDYKLTTAESVQGKNKFEVFAVFASHGFCDGGHTFYIGSNRRGPKALLSTLDFACRTVKEGVAERFENLPNDAPDAVNDGGVDVICVHEENNAPPARMWYFGQSAAGANYLHKSAISSLKCFDEVWFSTPPANRAGLMLIAFNPPDLRVNFQTRSLGHILHRMRLPKYAQIGRALYDNDNTKIHYVDNPDEPCDWLENYISRVKALKIAFK